MAASERMNKLAEELDGFLDQVSTSMGITDAAWVMQTLAEEPEALLDRLNGHVLVCTDRAHQCSVERNEMASPDDDAYDLEERLTDEASWATGVRNAWRSLLRDLEKNVERSILPYADTPLAQALLKVDALRMQLDRS